MKREKVDTVEKTGIHRKLQVEKGFIIVSVVL